MQKILGYVIENSIVKEEEAKILTHINVAFGHLTMNGELVFDYHPFLKQMKQEDAGFTAIFAFSDSMA